MGMRVMLGVFGMGLALTMSSVPSAWAADGDATAEAAFVEPVAVDTPAIEHADAMDTTREQILQEIESVRETDPELAAEMENQLQLLDSGELDLTGARDAALTAPTSEGATSLPGSATGQSGGGVGGMPSAMTPELREQLFDVFDSVGRGELTEDQARGQMETIMREHGIDSREMGQGYEGTEQEHREAFERAMEQMSPEAREQMEREFETFQREYELAAPESPEREFEASVHEYEAPEAPEGYEAPEHEYEMPAQQQYEAPSQP